MRRGASAFHQLEPRTAEKASDIKLRKDPMPPAGRRSGLFCEKGKGAWQQLIGRMKPGQSSAVLTDQQFESFRCAARRMGAKLRQKRLGPGEIQVWISEKPSTQGETR